MNEHLRREELEAEFSSLIKRLKQREEEHHRLSDYSNRILTRREELEQNIFIHDQISKFRLYHQERTVLELSLCDADQHLATKCQEMPLIDQEMVVLIKRVAARALELTYSALEAMREPIQYYSVTYSKFKQSCFKSLNDPQSLKLSSVIRILSKYIHGKVKTQLDRLQEIINCLESGDFSNLSNLKHLFYQLLNKKEHTVVQRVETSCNSTSRNFSKRQSQIRPIMSEKEVKIDRVMSLKHEKHEQKKKEKAKKLEMKKLKKFTQTLCDVMDLCKEQFMEDITAENKDWESRRMLNSLVERNRFNQTQIVQFLDKTNDYEEATTKDQKQLRSELQFHQQEVELQLGLISEKDPLNSRKSSIKKDQRSSDPFLPKRDMRYQKRDLIKTKNRSIYSKHRMTVNNIEESEQAKEKVFSSQKQINQDQFVEINLKPIANINRQRLPEIFTRASSVDTAKVLKKEKMLLIAKEDFRGKMKQIEQITSKEIISVPSNPTIEQLKNRAREKKDQKMKIELKSLGTNFFDEIGKKISQFCELKRNLVV